MSNIYTEDQLVEQPAIGLFASLGWQTISAIEETFGTTGTLQRETKGEVVDIVTGITRGATCTRVKLNNLAKVLNKHLALINAREAEESRKKKKK